MIKERIKEQIIGSWKLISMTYIDQQGNLCDFWGKDPEGILTYTSTGQVNVQFMRSDRSNFSTTAFGTGNPSEIAEAFRSYQAYFGTYTETEPGLLIHTLRGCLFPNWSGSDQIRHAIIIGNKLTLHTPPTPVNDSEISVDTLWEKLD